MPGSPPPSFEGRSHGFSCAQYASLNRRAGSGNSGPSSITLTPYPPWNGDPISSTRLSSPRMPKLGAVQETPSALSAWAMAPSGPIDRSYHIPESTGARIGEDRDVRLCFLGPAEDRTIERAARSVDDAPQALALGDEEAVHEELRVMIDGDRLRGGRDGHAGVARQALGQSGGERAAQQG